jgi:hypothetical protein
MKFYKIGPLLQRCFTVLSPIFKLELHLETLEMLLGYKVIVFLTIKNQSRVTYLYYWITYKTRIKGCKWVI